MVVGGGVAGLVAAYDLAGAGVEVTLVEASARLGGKLRSHVVGGLTLDAGAESFATRGGVVQRLVDDLGFGSAVVEPAPGGAWLQPARGDAVPLPKAGVLGIPATPLAADVIRAVGFAGAVRAQLDALMTGLPGSTERSLGRLVRKRMGRAVLDRLVTPVAGAIHGAHPDDLDVDVVAPRLREALLSRASLAAAVAHLREIAPAGAAVRGLDGGIARLAEELETAVRRVVDVRLSARVTAITAAAPDVNPPELGEHRADARPAPTLRAVELASGEVLLADHVVWAAAPEGAAGAPITLVTLVVAGGALLDSPRGTGVLVEPGATTATAKALTHATAKWPWLRAESGGLEVVRLSYEPHRLAGHDVLEQARADASALLGRAIRAADVVDSARVDWTGATIVEPPVVDGVTYVGEGISGAGIAGIIGRTRTEISRIIGSLAHDAG